MPVSIVPRHTDLVGLTTGDDHTQYVYLTPGSSTRNRIQATGDFPGLVIREQGTQTTALQQWVQSNGTTVGMQVMRRGTFVGELFNCGFGQEIPGGEDGSGGNNTVVGDKTGGGLHLYGAGISLWPKSDYVRIHNDLGLFSLTLARELGLVEAGQRSIPQLRQLTLSGTTADGSSAEAVRLRWDVNLDTPNAAAKLATFGYLNGSGVFQERLGILSQGDLILSRASTTQAREASRIASSFVVATDASRTGRIVISATDFNGTREVMRGEADGTNPMVGFLGAAAVTRRTLGASATNLATALTLVNNIRQALIDLGLGKN